MKVLPPAILFLEAVVVALGIPVAVTSTTGGAAAGWVLGLLAAGMARRPQGVVFGWILQVAVIAAGLIVPAMAVLGTVFLAVWITALVFGAKADRAAAANAAASRAAAADPPPADASGPTPSTG